MKENILFEEEQTFHQRWMDIVFMFVTIILLITFTVLMFSERDDSKEVSAILLAAIGLNLLVGYFLKRMRLITQIRTDGIYVRFPPLLPSFKNYRWEDIQQAFTRELIP